MITTSTGGSVDLVSIGHGGVEEIFLTAVPGTDDDLDPLLRQAHEVLAATQAEILEVRVFGSANAFQRSTDLLRSHLTPVDWPLTRIDGGGCFKAAIGGIQIHAITGSGAEALRLQDRYVGKAFEDESARYCILGDLHSLDLLKPRERQTKDTIQRMLESLALAGMDIYDIVRTWFFVDDILGWYGDFNRVRSEIYTEAGVFDRFLPASTGIGGPNSHGAAVIGTAMGVEAKGEGVTVRELPSPLQCPAFDYGSSFSRAAELETRDCRTVFVSGTASIDPDGATVHLDDPEAQIAFTLEVVNAILESRGMNFSHVVRGNAYFKDRGDAARLEGHSRKLGLPLPRIVVSQNFVCRDDLLFELEVQAMKVKD